MYNKNRKKKKKKKRENQLISYHVRGQDTLGRFLTLSAQRANCFNFLFASLQTKTLLYKEILYLN